ncbi:DUF3658 domain-containing protein [Lysobacter capsici]|uniref:DUF3658 domain-containing protein n=1 Tax=Lysobacter capsici TaxID=435897 RepID=UPI001C007BB3|nr:DUF3658 domain-containing protein [Lysobacter capsici]QWF16982.1 DUF3658 domain-containing protein [Lysobacter capsici]
MRHPDGHEPEDRQPDPEQSRRIADLSPDQIQAIDAALLAAADIGWRKVAFLVATVMTGPARVPGIADVYYAQRVRALVANGSLVAQGVLSRMRYSEVRIAGEAGVLKPGNLFEPDSGRGSTDSGIKPT